MTSSKQIKFSVIRGIKQGRQKSEKQSRVARCRGQDTAIDPDTFTTTSDYEYGHFTPCVKLRLR